MNILDEIISRKRREVAQAKIARPVESLIKSDLFGRECYSFEGFIRDPSRTGIIAEFKKRSPSKGWINIDADPVQVTRGYTSYGASALSVLTDQHFFGGDLEDLRKARVNEIPILRKDFIIDEYQLIESKAAGADVILLIAACLTKEEVKSLSHTAGNLGLHVFLEIHCEEELESVCDSVDVVGINNRNLKTFEVDLQHSISLARQLPSICKVSESGIDSLQTVHMLREHGFDGFLIGERFMKATHPAQAFRNFLKSDTCG